MKSLRISILALSLCGLAIVATPAMAADMMDGSVSVVSPANGAVLDSGKDIKLTYNVKLSPTGNHLHIYVDDMSPIIDRDVSGCPCSLTLPTLAPGKHTVAVREATVHHNLTGLETSVSFTVK